MKCKKFKECGIIAHKNKTITICKKCKKSLNNNYESIFDKLFGGNKL